MLKGAIIGAGAIADTHIHAFLKFNDICKITALVDIYPEKAHEKAQRYGLQAQVYRDTAELLEKGDFDFASICLPPFAHASAAVDLLKAGKHVLVEKPMATCLSECDQMIGAARKGSALLSVVAQNRFRNDMNRLKRILDSGLLGKIVHAQIDSFWWRGQKYYDLWWRGTWEKEGGGCTMNHAVHQIDLFHWMIGMPDELLALVTNVAHQNSEVEDFSTAILLYDRGQIGQITASLLHHGEEQEFVIQGEKASIKVPWTVKAFFEKDNGFPEENPALVADIQELYAQLPDLPYTGHEGQIHNFLAAVLGQEPLLVDGEAGRRTIELVTAIYQSGIKGERVRLPLKPDNLFYTRQGILQNAPHFHEKTRSVDNFADNTISVGSINDPQIKR